MFMKKRMIMLVAVLALSVGFGIYRNYQKNLMSDLLLANIEALANYEWNQDGWYCWRFSQDDYSSDRFFCYIRCFDCYTSTATTVWEQGQCWH